jgi:2-oxoisovalerate dehydrogenase E1 component
VPEDYYTIEIGKARVARSGDDMSIITYGMGVHWASEVVEEMGIDAEIVDLRSLLPWDKETVGESVKKTSRVLILHEDTLTGGIGAELAAWIAEKCFRYLDAPVIRVASLDTPVPFAASLEQNFLPKGRLRAGIRELMKF